MQTPAAQSRAFEQRPEVILTPFFPHAEHAASLAHMLLHPVIKPAQQVTIAIVINLFIAYSSRLVESRSETSARNRSCGFTPYAAHSASSEIASHGGYDR